MSTPSGAVVGAVASRPRLWPTALRQARALASPGWWRRRPFLPVPDRRWMEFRLTTAYGDPAAPMDPDDLVVWLDWSRQQRVRRRARMRAAGSAETPGHRARVHG